MKYIYPRFKDIHPLLILPYGYQNKKMSEITDKIHNIICGCCKSTSKSIDKRGKIQLREEYKCGFQSESDINKKYGFITTDITRHTPIPEFEIKGYERYRKKWLKDNYQKILNNLVTHKELLYIINKVDYEQFYKLFINSNLIDEYDNPIDFLLLIAFIGSNGTVLKLC